MQGCSIFNALRKKRARNIRDSAAPTRLSSSAPTSAPAASNVTSAASDAASAAQCDAAHTRPRDGTSATTATVARPKRTNNKVMKKATNTRNATKYICDDGSDGPAGYAADACCVARCAQRYHASVYDAQALHVQRRSVQRPRSEHFVLPDLARLLGLRPRQTEGRLHSHSPTRQNAHSVPDLR